MRPMDDETRENLLKIVDDYRNGHLELWQAEQMMLEEGGIFPKVSRVFLRNMKKENVVNLRDRKTKEK